MKNTSQMQNKERVSKVTHPSVATGYAEWLEEFRVSSRYLKPTPYFQGNELNFSVYGKPTLFQRVSKFLNII